MKRLLFCVIAVVILMTHAVIVQASPASKLGFECYGANRDFFYYRGESMLAGPFETGKTMTGLNKLHLLLSKYPRAQALVVRETYKSLIGSFVPTWEKKVLPFDPDDKRSAVKKYGGEKPEWYDYVNGSRLTLGGMDNPDKFLSAEYDFIYEIQAEGLNLDHHEKLTGRATGRAGNVPYPLVFGDCNPGPPTHWIVNRPQLKVFYSRHEDNPTLFDQLTGEITERGKRTMAVLDALTGVRYKRGRLGLWVAAEGQVYEEFEPALHLLPARYDIPASWRRIRVVDFGYTNPFVCLWIAIDPDGRMILYREIYMTQRLVEDHAREILRLSQGERIETTICDHDAEDRATLDRHGIPTERADKALSTGIQTFQTRLRKAGDGKPRFYVMPDSLVETDLSLKAMFQPCSILDEFPVYVWPIAKDGKPIKEVPVDLNNHALDAVRYGAMYLDGYGDIQQYENPFYGED